MRQGPPCQGRANLGEGSLAAEQAPAKPKDPPTQIDRDELQGRAQDQANGDNHFERESVAKVPSRRSIQGASGPRRSSKSQNPPLALEQHNVSDRFPGPEPHGEPGAYAQEIDPFFGPEFRMVKPKYRLTLHLSVVRPDRLKSLAQSHVSQSPRRRVQPQPILQKAAADNSIIANMKSAYSQKTSMFPGTLPATTKAARLSMSGNSLSLTEAAGLRSLRRHSAARGAFRPPGIRRD